MKKTIICSLILLCSFGVASAQKLNVASYNVRYDSSSDAEKGDGWKQRMPILCQLIKYNDFDFIGTQEVLQNQLNDMLGQLDDYSYIGAGRDDGKTQGEYVPIFYKKDKYNVIKSGHFWLSEHTEYANKGWDAAYPRICTWGQFTEKDSGFKFWFFNIHMDHIGEIAQFESAKLILAKIKELCGNDPVVLTGDFNVDQTSESYEMLSATPSLIVDSYEVAKLRYALNGTFNDFQINLKTDSRIDHIFVSPAFSVEKYAVLTDTYRSEVENTAIINSDNSPKETSLKEYTARIPSDHYPVRAVLNYKKK